MTIRRREFITLLGGAAAWPLEARAQQPAAPVIGVLQVGTAADSIYLPALREGLRDAGYVEGRNLVVEYRFAENHYDRLPALAADLVRRQVAAIFASGGGLAVPTAKAATTTIPIVFAGGFDPVQSGLVSSLNRPSGNVTGVSFAANISDSKRLGLLHAMVPSATVIGVLMNPDNANFEKELRDLNEAARALGLKLQIANARNEGDFEPAFASFIRQGAGGLVVQGDAFFARRIEQLAALAARYSIPAIYIPAADTRAFAAAGGLMSYGASISTAFHQAGIYIGRILHGERPGDLPVLLPTKFELVINLKTAKALGIEVPPALSAIADEVIE
jgi:putative tryptophan/tyrosine transport system substrate-binding protein